MKIRVVDLETTGDDRQKKNGETVAICEVGYTDVYMTSDGPSLQEPKSLLVNPGFPMPYDARAVHHISDDMLAGAPSPSVGTAFLMEGMEPQDFFAAHNMSFERTFFGGGNIRWICTYVVAKHLFTDARSYANQSIRYMLGVDEFPWFNQEFAHPPHRAGPDSYVTAASLVAILKHHQPEHLEVLTRTPVLLKTVGFGKHRGRPWADMDAGFLQWVLDKDFDNDVKNTARHYLGGKRNAEIGF